MTETLPVYADSYAANPSRPFNALEELCSPEFIKACLDAERRLDIQQMYASSHVETTRTEKEIYLNDIFDADMYMYEQIVASGKVYPESTILRRHDMVDIQNMSLRYGGLAIMPTEQRNGLKYRTVFRLLSETPGTYSYCAPLDTTNQLDFPGRIVTDFDPSILCDALKNILQRSRDFRSQKSFQKKTQIEKMERIEEKADAYTAELAPFFDQDIPLIINTDRYAAYATNTKKRQNERTQFNLNPKTRHIIAGRLVEVTFRSLFAINPNIPPLLVLQNTHDDIRYEIPLDAVISNMIPLHATVYR